MRQKCSLMIYKLYWNDYSKVLGFRTKNEDSNGKAACIMICCFPTVLVKILQSFETFLPDRILIFAIVRCVWDELCRSCAPLC